MKAKTMSPYPNALAKAALVAIAAGALLLTGCGEKKNKVPGQTAAKVNKEEITIHQINAVLQQQRGLRPEQADAASRQVLERLIDQELADAKAEELKLDRDPRVLQQLEATRRDILARAYVEKVGDAAIKPSAEDIKKYYDDKPALFKQRRIYNIQEINVEVRPEQFVPLREKLEGSKTITDFLDYLKANDFKFQGSQAVRAAEQLPLQSLDTFAKMKDGQAIMIPGQNVAQVVVLAGSRVQPLSEEQAQPVIEQYLLNERKRKLVEDDLKAMRAAAKIEYIGKFAEGGAGAASAAPQPAAAASAGSAPAEDIAKGMGLKK